MAATRTRPPVRPRRPQWRSRDGIARLLAPAAVRMVDLDAPLQDLCLSPADGRPPYRSLVVVARLGGAPLGVATFLVGPCGCVSRARLSRGLRRRFGDDLRARARPERNHRESHNGSRALRLVDTAPAPPVSPLVSVIVPTCANPQALESCVRSILASDYGDFEVIVVENRPGASETASMLASHFRGEPRLRYVEEPRRGASRARDAGLAQVEGEIVAFTDDDVVVDRDWIRASVEALMSADDVACVTGLILPLELESDSQLLMEQFAAFGKGFQRNTYRLPDAREDNPLFPYTAGAIGSGASIVLRTGVARDLGGFDPALGPATPTTGGEDLDLLIRVLRAGHAVSYEPSAIVWHRHPDGMPRLRRQVYRYGVGLGAMLGKQLIAGPERGELVRAVPAGVRYARDPASRKNAAKPTKYPRHLTCLEWLGMLMGPIAYVVSALRELQRRFVTADRTARPTRLRRWIVLSTGETVRVVWFRRAEIPRQRVVRHHRLRHGRSGARDGPRPSGAREWPRPARFVLLAAAATCVAAPLCVALPAPAALRETAVLAFLCFAPGTALLTALRGRFEPGLVVGVSMGVAAVVAQSMLWLGTWSPRTVLYGAAAACLLPLLWRLVARSAHPPAVRMPAWLGARPLPRVTVVHGTLLCGALLAWASSLPAADLSRMDGIGLLGAMPLTFYLAFALLLVGFAVAARSEQIDPKLLGAYVLALILVLHATTALLYDEPRYAWTYKHLGVINLIAATGRADRQIDIYNNWPAFFAANAWLSKTSGLAPIAYAGWAQLFFNVCGAFTVRFALRGLTRDERLLWTATFLFVLGNWVGQDYLAPQAFGFVLSLVVLGLCLRCGPAAMRPRSGGDRSLVSKLPPLRAVVSRRTAHEEPATRPLGSKGALLAGGICYVAVVTSHQLSPVLLLLSVLFLAAFTRRVPLWVPAAMLAIEVWWLVLAWPFVRTHFSLIDPGTGGAAAPDRNLAAALPGAAFSFYAPVAVMMLIAALALFGIFRRLRAGKWDVAPACFIGAPVLAVAVQSYGGEGAYRAYLFALPWLAFFAAHACTQSSSPLFGAPRPGFGRLIGATTAVCVCLLFAYFGQELDNRIPSEDVRAAVWYEQHAPPGSIRIDLAPSSPSRLTPRYPLVSLGDPSSLLQQPGFSGHLLGAADVPRLVDLISRQGTHPAHVVLSRAQEDYGRLNGLLPKGSAASFAQALERSPGFALVYRRPNVWVFKYTPGAAVRVSARPDRLLTR